MTEQFNKMQTLKRRFFAMRNGLLAEQLRRAGSTFRIIFGLNVIQLNEIANDYGHDADFAAMLWQNSTTRESMLIAPMLWHPEDFSADEAVALCKTIPEPEIADMVSHKLLRHREDAISITETLLSHGGEVMRYTALRLTLSLLGGKISAGEAIGIAESELQHATPLTASLATMLRNEASFLMEEGEDS